MDQLLYDSLTPMERNCLRLAHHERKAEQIAHQLGIKASTVNSHVFSARKKLGGISRLSAADQLRQFEAVHSGARPGQIESDLVETARGGRDGADSDTQQPMFRQPLRVADPALQTAVPPHPAEVREQRSVFVFDDERLTAHGGQEQDRDVALRRLALTLAIAALVALVLIAAPAIYDSTAQRIANSLERPHR